MRKFAKYCVLMAAVSWTSGAEAAPPQTGRQIYTYWCATCHGPGPRMPGTAALAAKYGKDLPAALELRKDLTPDVVRFFVRQGVSVMPHFRKTEISDTELDALASYLSHSER